MKLNRVFQLANVKPSIRLARNMFRVLPEASVFTMFLVKWRTRHADFRPIATDGLRKLISGIGAALKCPVFERSEKMAAQVVLRKKRALQQYDAGQGWGTTGGQRWSSMGLKAKGVSLVTWSAFVPFHFAWREVRVARKREIERARQRINIWCKTAAAGQSGSRLSY